MCSVRLVFVDAMHLQAAVTLSGPNSRKGDLVRILHIYQQESSARTCAQRLLRVPPRAEVDRIHGGTFDDLNIFGVAFLGSSFIEQRRGVDPQNKSKEKENCPRQTS